jgi:hypothetical protein
MITGEGRSGDSQINGRLMRPVCGLRSDESIWPEYHQTNAKPNCEHYCVVARDWMLPDEVKDAHCAPPEALPQGKASSQTAATQ